MPPRLATYVNTSLGSASARPDCSATVTSSPLPCSAKPATPREQASAPESPIQHPIVHRIQKLTFIMAQVSMRKEASLLPGHCTAFTPRPCAPCKVTTTYFVTPLKESNRDSSVLVSLTVIIVIQGRGTHNGSISSHRTTVTNFQRGSAPGYDG